MSKEQSVEMNAKELMSDAKFYESYARYDEEKGRYETWEEAVARVMNMHRTFYADKMTPELSELIDISEKAYAEKELLGAQRALQFGGEQLLKNHAKLYNCTATYLDRVDFFKEAMFLMLSGCGIGFSVQKQHVALLPDIARRSTESNVFVVPDSIEGWSDAMGVLLSSYFVSGGNEKYRGKKVFFDLSEIRPKGSKISGGFKAPGSEPLRIALERIEKLLNAELDNGITRLRTIVAYDVTMHMADAVISGGVRRAASICLFSKDDEAMVKAKTGSWYTDNPQRARSNNSAVLLRGETSPQEFADIMKYVKEYGEPGFVWADDLEILFNPCVTSDTSVMTSEGPRQVQDLIGKQFKAVVNGKEFETTEKGFWETGTKNIFKLTLDDGSNLKLTENHKVLTLDGWKELRNLSPDDKVTLHNHDDYRWGAESKKDKNIGWLLGNLVGDGTFSGKNAILRYWGEEKYLIKTARKYLTEYMSTYKEFNGGNSGNIISVGSVNLKKTADKYNILQRDKAPSHKLEEESSDFYIGYIQGLFDADGSVQGNTKKGISVRLTQNNLDILEQVQRMLLRLGIKSKIFKERRSEGYYSLPDAKGGMADFLCKAVHDLVITRSSLQKYNDIIGFKNKNKKQILKKLLATYTRELYKSNYYSSVQSIVHVGCEKVYDVTVPGPEAFDANGLYVHNCVEVGMYGRDENGVSGWQMCNLTEINGAKANTPEEFYAQCKHASIIGTLQAGYTDYKYLTNVTKSIVEKEALIGVGITGWMNNPDVLFDKAVQKKGAEIVKEWNKKVAKMIGINQAARTTVVKPSGNASVILGTASGIHGEHSKRYLRHVQMNKDTEVSQMFQKFNPKMVSESVWSTDGTDVVIAFPIVTQEGSIYKSDLLGTKQLEYVKNAQDNWIEHGTNHELCVKPFLKHNVSNTITVDDWDEVEKFIYDNRTSLCGVSLLPASGDKAYPQAPFTEVLTMEEITEKYGTEAMFTSGLVEAGLNAFNNDLWSATMTAMGHGEKLTEEHKDLMKRDFVRRFDKFSTHFKSKDECSDCLKDVYNLHKWWKIQSSMHPIDYVNNLSKKEYVDIDTLGSQGCAGGACETAF